MSLRELLGWRERLAKRRAPGPSGSTSMPHAGSSPAAPAEGRRLGSYRLEREIGHGAVGTVWLAAGADGRPVAVKTVPLSVGADPDDADNAREVRERFAREALAARRLDHPGIVAVLDAGESEGLAWIAMAYVAGRDLSVHATPGRLLPWPGLVGLLAGAAEALAHAHRQGIVHRDIKPANLLLDEASGRLKIADFGVARIADAARTRTDLMLGTPSFMAPEQLAGAPVDARSDVYALGVTAFQLLSGHLPYEAASMGALMTAIARAPVPKLRQWRPDLPPALEDVVALAMEKQPALRYASAGQFAEDLRAIASGLGDIGAVALDAGAQAVNSVEQAPRPAPGAGGEPRHNLPHGGPAVDR